MSEYKQLIIKPVVKPKFSGISKYAKTVTVLTGAQLSMKTGLYKTGLTNDQEDEYEKVLNLPKGSLNKRAPFWGELEIRLFNDKPTYFTIVSPMDEIRAAVLGAHTIVANNETDLQNNPMAEFYVEDLEGKAKVEEVGLNLEYEAMMILMESSAEDKKGLLKLYPNTKGVDTFSETLVKTELMKRVKDNPKRFIEFSKDPDLKVRILIEELLEAGKLTKKGSFYNYEGEVIGNSVEAAINFFKDLKNQSIKLVAEQDLKKTKKTKDSK